MQSTTYRFPKLALGFHLFAIGFTNLLADIGANPFSFVGAVAAFRLCARVRSRRLAPNSTYHRAHL